MKCHQTSFAKHFFYNYTVMTKVHHTGYIRNIHKLLYISDCFTGTDAHNRNKITEPNIIKVTETNKYKQISRSAGVPNYFKYDKDPLSIVSNKRQNC